jgi:hypothetical protein
MARQNISVGQFANDRTGDPLRNAFIKTNQNFKELYDDVEALGLDLGEAIQSIPTDVSQLTDEQGLLGGGSGGEPTPFLPYLDLTNNAFIVQNIELGESFEFIKEDGDASNTSIDFISSSVALTRGNQGALYNFLTEEFSNSDISPQGTLWNSDGWGDLKDYRKRDYVSFVESLDYRVGEVILDKELIMWDLSNDKYYTFKFSSWTQGGNGGGFSYTRREITDPNIFIKRDGEEISDIFVVNEPEGSGIAITRGNNQGIYNPFQENFWNANESPLGTLWNADGWQDLTNVESRNYINFYDALDGGLGNNVPNRELVMFIPSTNEYYAIKFSSWTQGGNGGGFAYERYRINLEQLNEGITFSDGTIQKSAYIETNILSTAENKRRIETQDGFSRIELTELVVGDTFTGTIYQSASNTRFIQISSNPQIDSVYQANERDIQISLDENEWIDARITGFSTIPVLRYFVETIYDGDRVTVEASQEVFIRTRSGAEPVRWFRAQGDDFRGAIIDFHAYSQNSGTIVGTIHIIRDAGENNITHTEVKSGDFSRLPNLDIWFRKNNEREIWARRIDGEADRIGIHWHGKFFYGTEYWD